MAKDEYHIYRNVDTGQEFFMGLHKSEGFDAGDLSREAMSYLGEWQIFMKQDGYGLAYRLGVKSGYKDDEGDPMELYLHFALPVARRGHELTDPEKAEVHQSLVMVMQLASQAWAIAHSGLRVVSIEVPPPDYMVKDLEAMLK